MRNFSIPLFTLTVCAVALLTVPIIPPLKAAGNSGGEVEKTRKRNQRSASQDLQSPGFGDLRSPTLPTFPPPMNNDFDRKAGSGGGM